MPPFLSQSIISQQSNAATASVLATSALSVGRKLDALNALSRILVTAATSLTHRRTSAIVRRLQDSRELNASTLTSRRTPHNTIPHRLSLPTSLSFLLPLSCLLLLHLPPPPKHRTPKQFSVPPDLDPS
ncbi:hypothetical protein B5X24_HaOG205095 [Helicoverpa armigera]|uniref:Uncharacterized protein n=1 Tax=Helicoverpa armigera TaxID=29058 RepID=A0A2W1BR49_HELAM|nr:hypothetical protein B5X24_HaOG205095 [Helicoverpa armigera]